MSKSKQTAVRFVEYGKLSKKARKERDAKQRGSWYGLDPVSRVVPNKKAYDRGRAKRESRDCMAFA